MASVRPERHPRPQPRHGRPPTATPRTEACSASPGWPMPSARPGGMRPCSIQCAAVHPGIRLGRSDDTRRRRDVGPDRGRQRHQQCRRCAGLPGDDLERVRTVLAAQGVFVEEPITEVPGAGFLNAHDLDGNRLMFFSTDNDLAGGAELMATDNSAGYGVDRLSGRIVVVTGGANGIGRSVPHAPRRGRCEGRRR